MLSCLSLIFIEEDGVVEQRFCVSTLSTKTFVSPVSCESIGKRFWIAVDSG